MIISTLPEMQSAAAGRIDKFSKKLDFALIFIGVSLRCYHYLMARSLWVDEAMLAVNIVSGSYHDLFAPLKYNQIAPIGFLVPVKLIVSFLGNNEYALRLLPFACSLLSILLLYWTAKRILSPYAATLALFLFVFADPLIIHSSEVKPYSCDVFFSLLLTLLFVASNDDSKSTGHKAAILFAGSAAVWFSFPSAFVLASIGIVWIFQPVGRPIKHRFGYPALCIAVWIVSFGVHLSLVQHKIHHVGMETFWAKGFMPIFPSKLADLRWFMDTFFSMFSKEPTRLFLPGIGGVCFLAGLASLYQRKLQTFLLCVLPLAITLLASGFHLYPFHSRMILFLVPFLFLVVAEGVQFFDKTLRVRSRWVANMFVFILLVQPVTCQAYRIMHPFFGEEIKPVLQFVSENIEKNDRIYVYHAARPAFEYYSERFDLNQIPVISGASGRNDLNRYIEDLLKLRGQKRVWFVFSHVPDWTAMNEELFFLFQLDRLGKRQREKKVHGASAYLYDLSETDDTICPCQ